MCRSVPQMATRRTLRSTSSGAGTGSGTSRISAPGAGRLFTQAFIVSPWQASSRSPSCALLGAKQRGERRPRVRGGHQGHLFRRSRGYHATSGLATLGTEIDQVVRRLDDVEVVLDDDHRVAAIDQAVEHLEELAHVIEVKAGRRLVEEIH